MKKIISLLLTFIMAIAVCGLVACKKDNDNNNKNGGETGIEYELVKRSVEDGGNYFVVSGFNLSDEDSEKLADGSYKNSLIEVAVKAEHKDEESGKTYPVTEIAEEAFLDQLIIKSIKVPSSIEKIGAGAFSGCTSLKSIELPFIGESREAVNEKKVFGYIFGTTSKDSATEVKQEYNKAAATTSYYIPNSLTKVAFTGEELSEYAFNAWTTLKEIVLPDTLTSIPTGAFKGCTGFNEFPLPVGVTEIGPEAFKGCNALINFTFNTVVETIGANAFEDCTSLNKKKALAFPASLTKIEERAFKGCLGLIGIDLSKSNCDYIGEAAFNGCTELKTVAINPAFENTMKIGVQAFVGCDKLTADNVTGLNFAGAGVSNNAFPYGINNG